MAGYCPPLNKVDQKTAEADQIMEYFKQQVLLLKAKATLQASVREEKKLLVENAKLKKDIDELKGILVEKHKKRGARRVATPSGDSVKSTASEAADASPSAGKSPTHKNHVGRRRRADRRGETETGQTAKAAASDKEARVDVSRLDLRVGRIISATKHPTADSLCVGEVDVGEAVPRSLVSGVVKHVPLDQMQNRMAVLLCNLKPSKMRGALSQAMVMCASSLERVELLDPPSGAVPGDRVTVQSFPGEPDKELNPKKKVWEKVKSDLRTDAKCVATYKGAALEVRGKGFCKAQTMSTCGIK